MLFRIFAIAIAYCSFTFGAVPDSITFFEDKPRGVAKDFHIYRYLKEAHPSPKEAWKLLEHTNKMSMKLFHAFANRLGEPGFKKVSTCMKMKLADLLKSDTTCIAIGLSMYEATKLPKAKIKMLQNKLQNYDIAKYLSVLYADNVYEALLKQKPEIFFGIYNRVGKAYRRSYFDKELPKEFLKSLQGNWQLNSSIKYTLLDPKMQNIKKSLIYVDRHDETLSHQTLFLLGLNALQLRYNKLALAFFDEAFEKAYYRMDKDKVLFWQFLATKDEAYKDRLKESFDLNIYTLLAGVKNDRIMIAKAWEKHPNYNEKDPFGWTKFLNSIKDKNATQLESMAQDFLYGSTLPHYSFLMEKASGYKDHYFPLPYKQYLGKVSNHRLALTMAIARQESRLIPSAISHSYALGMMQFMPFLARAIAKEKKLKNFDLVDMFDPKTALSFANHHLDYLEKFLYHPLFVAYAYNGGIGFTKKLLQSGTFLQGPYEPFMSMELVHYDESRKYGKKVLANYITYMQILGEDVSVYELFEKLTDPSQTDKFREAP